MTDAERLKLLKAGHEQGAPANASGFNSLHNCGEEYCWVCRGKWPCDGAWAAARIETLEAQLGSSLLPTLATIDG